MQHIAIMKKSWGLLEKILSGKKKIESRWYMSKYAPWGRICAGETIYFKNSGSPVSLKAEVEKVLQFENLNPEKIREILDKWGGADGIAIEDIPKFSSLFKNKKYCILIFLKNPQTIEPFEINKKGFGNMSAWICVGDVERIRK